MTCATAAAIGAILPASLWAGSTIEISGPAAPMHDLSVRASGLTAAVRPVLIPSATQSRPIPLPGTTEQPTDVASPSHLAALMDYGRREPGTVLAVVLALHLAIWTALP